MQVIVLDGELIVRYWENGTWFHVKDWKEVIEDMIEKYPNPDKIKVNFVV